MVRPPPWVLTAGGAVLAGLLLVRGVGPALVTADRTDFLNYWAAARLLLDGEDPARFYVYADFQRHLADLGFPDHRGKFDPFPPPTAFLMLPIAWMDATTALRVWTVLKIAVVAFEVALVARLGGWSRTAAAALVLAGGIGLWNDFRLGQVYVPLATVCAAALLLVDRRPALAGALLGAAAAVKLFPAAFLAVLVLHRRWRVLAGAAGAVGVAALGSLAVFGLTACQSYLLLVLPDHLLGRLPGQSPFAVAFQSWPSFLRNAVGPAMGDHLKAVLGSAAILVAWALIRSWRHPEALRLHLGLVAMAALALLPASATYHYTLLVLPVALLVPALPSPRTRVIVVVLAVLAGVPIPQVVLDLRGPLLPLAFPRLWLMTALFAVAAVAVGRRPA